MNQVVIIELQYEIRPHEVLFSTFSSLQAHVSSAIKYTLGMQFSVVTQKADICISVLHESNSIIWLQDEICSLVVIIQLKMNSVPKFL